MDAEAAAHVRFARFARAVLVYNLPVILWGAVVRSTSSGAGCRDRWPLCDGAITPQHTIELSHRITSGLVIPLTGILLWWALRLFPKGHLARVGAAFSFVLALNEALIGAGLVLFKLVDRDNSAYRAMAMSAHLTNTLLLLGALALTAWWAGDPKPIRLRAQGALGGLLAIGLAVVLITGVTGAVTALGDTLYPPSTIAEIGRSAPSTAHFLVRLRVYHPFIAVGATLFVAALAAAATYLRSSDRVRDFAFGAVLIAAAQVGVGIINLFLRVPIWTQLTHLLLADLLWIDLVLLTAAACTSPARERAVSGLPRPFRAQPQP